MWAADLDDAQHTFLTLLKYRQDPGPYPGTVVVRAAPTAAFWPPEAVWAQLCPGKRCIAMPNALASDSDSPDHPPPCLSATAAGPCASAATPAASYFQPSALAAGPAAAAAQPIAATGASRGRSGTLRQRRCHLLLCMEGQARVVCRHHPKLRGEPGNRPGLACGCRARWRVAARLPACPPATCDSSRSHGCLPHPRPNSLQYFFECNGWPAWKQCPGVLGASLSRTASPVSAFPAGCVTWLQRRHLQGQPRCCSPGRCSRLNSSLHHACSPCRRLAVQRTEWLV